MICAVSIIAIPTLQMRYSEDMIINLKSKCPACMSQGEVMSKIDSSEAASHFKNDTSSSEDFRNLRLHIEQLWKSNSCLRRKCGSCHLIFADPFTAGDSFFYNLAHSSHVYPKNRWEYSVTLNHIRNLFDSNFHLLEIGAGKGEFLVEVLSQGIFAENLLAIEFDKVGAGKIRDLGIACLEVDLRNADLSGSPGFSAIVMFQVFEHLDDLDSFLKILVSLLKDRGKVVVSVPNNRRIEFIEKSLGFIDMPPNHVATWNDEALRIIFERNHLTMKHFEVESAKFLAFAYTIIYYSILKRRQGGTGLEKRFLGFKSRKLRIVTFAAFSIFHLFFRLPALLKFNSNLGGSQLAVFEKS